MKCDKCGCKPISKIPLPPASGVKQIIVTFECGRKKVIVEPARNIDDLIK